MIKTDIIDIVYEKIGFTRTEATDAVEMVFSVIKETLERGEDLSLSGFGNFILINKNDRPGRNPKTGKEITISSRRVITFKASKKFKERL